MNSREKILNAVKASQPALQPLPQLDAGIGLRYEDPVAAFSETVKNIGGAVIPIQQLSEIAPCLMEHFGMDKQYKTTIDALPGIPLLPAVEDAHRLDGISVAVIPAVFGVAENGAVWVTEREAGERVLPFICEHLAIVLDRRSIFSNMHQAYDHIGNEQYGYGVFIAGPSKTADIEQSLVLGAHGPKSMTVFLVS
jgi:L-lactate dehydrogenase complex protein LldG